MLDLSFQSTEEDQTLENLEQEIECPRCFDVMTLSSDFDGLLYMCPVIHPNFVPVCQICRHPDDISFEPDVFSPDYSRPVG